MHALITVEELRRLDDADRRSVEVREQLQEEFRPRDEVGVEDRDEVAVAVLVAEAKVACLLQVPWVRPRQVGKPALGGCLAHLITRRVVEDVDGDLTRPGEGGDVMEGVLEDLDRLPGRGKENVDCRELLGLPAVDARSVVGELQAPPPEGGPHRSRHREQGEGKGRNEEAENEMRRREQRHAHADQRVGDDRDREQPPVLPPQVPVLLGVRRR